MKRTSADLLEYESLRELIGRYVSSPLGQARLAAMEPHSDRAVLESALADAAEGLAWLREAESQRGGARRLNFSSLPDLSMAVERVRIEGSALDGREIYDLLAFLDRAADMRATLNAAAGRYPRLGAHGGAIAEFRPLLHDLSGKVLPDGSLDDRASPVLAKLRREIARQREAIHASLERFVREHSGEGDVRDAPPTVRNDRFVVPIVSGARKRIQGVIHGASSSGQTLFVEPLATIDLNNDLVRLTEEELRESYRIFREMTERLRGYAASIRAAYDAVGELEWIFAKARFAAAFDCTIPSFTERRLSLRGARHPMLADVLRRQGKLVVPCSIDLTQEHSTLLISGPNTGGKTVTMKTVGITILMAQSGLPVPCERAELPLFDQVLADIGDNQSIEQSLSTFSAHVARLRQMVQDVTSDSLVLLDELGAATDPEEGGALGIAVLDHFRTAGATTVASTHLLALKVYGAATPQVVNASMGFDDATLDPTYILHTGAPGKSAGLAIASRLGMPEPILERARASLTTREQDISWFLAELHRNLEATSRLQTDLERREATLAQREADFARDAEKREKLKLAELEQRLEQVITKFEATSRETLDQIRESASQRKAAEHAARDIARTKRELREEFSTTVLQTSAGTAAPAGEIAIGARVRLRSVREPARVRRLIGDNRLEVEAGFLKMQVSVGDVLEILPEAAAPKSKLPKNVSFRPAPEFAPIHQELNVIGRRADEAVDAVERFLDQSVMATAARVRIVHGHGMGVLKRSIAELLRGHPHVEKFYEAQQFEGGAGATIVELRE